MALQQTTLSAACTASATTLAVTSTAAFPPVGTTFVNQVVLIDTEFMVCIGVPAIGSITVRSRGYEGTAAVAHDILANVYTTANNADFGPISPALTVQIDPTDDAIVSVGQDGAITVPITNTAVNINKATAAALTLAAPLLSDNGVTLMITSQTAAAHVVTATALINDGTVTTPKTTMTFVAGRGATVTLVAENGLWNVSAQVGVTFS